jgi:hypothetical protein
MARRAATLIQTEKRERISINVLYATSQEVFFPNEVEFISQLAITFPKVSFTIRVHPQEPPKKFLRIKKLENVDLILPPEHSQVSPDGLNPYIEDLDEIIEQIKSHDITLLTASSMLFDCMALGGRVALLRLANENNFSTVRALYKADHAKHLLEVHEGPVIDSILDIQRLFEEKADGKLDDKSPRKSIAHSFIAHVDSI